MRKNLLGVVLATIPFLGYSQIFQENFDGNGPGIGAWTIIDVDGNTPAEDLADFTSAWIRKDRGGETPNYGGPDGDYAAMSTSWYDPAGTSNDWLISPSFTVSGASPTLYWDAKAQDASYRDGYKVMLAPNGGNTVADFTVELLSVPAESSTWKSRAIQLTPYIGTNVRIAFVNNSNDKYVLLVDNIKVDYTYVEPPISYCGPLLYEGGVEPITLVKFAGIDNTTDATLDGSDAHEMFLDKIANVTQGQTYQITLKGNTGGAYNNYFSVFMDWNQNGSLDDAGEAYVIPTALNTSTGTDAKEITFNIAVPAGATLGETRMRVKKVYGSTIPATMGDPCTDGGGLFGAYGQAEDYTVAVGSLAVSDISKASISIYPNPVVDVLNITAASKVTAVSVYDMSGKNTANYKLNDNKSQVNLSKLAPGAYVVKITTETGVQTVKVIKK